METFGADDEQNKRWLTLMQVWVEKEKNDPFCVLFAEDECSLVEEFKKNEEQLVQYLSSLDAWLSKYGMKEALKQMPSVGKLLSQLCKIPLVQISDSVSKVLLNCILHLSNILNPVKDDHASKRANKWAVNHLSTMINVDAEGIDLFLMEEFGISQEEYLEEQVKQSSLQLLELFRHQNHNTKSIPEDYPPLKTVFEFLEMAYNKLLSPVYEGTIYMADSLLNATQQSHCLYEKQLFCLSQNKEIMKNFSAESLHVLFTIDITSFENYILLIIEEITEAYPGLHRELVETIIRERRLVELCCLDVRYYHGVVRIIKDSFLVIGLNPGLIELLRTIVKKYKEGYKLIRFGFPHCSALEELLMESPKGLQIHNQEVILTKIDEILSNITPSNIKSDFEIWFQLAQYADWIDEAISLLFEGSRQNVSIHLKVILRFFYPTVYNGLLSYLQPVTSYVYALRNLLQKNHIQLSDLEFLSSSLKRKLSPDADISIVLNMLAMLFLGKSYGDGSITENPLEHMFGEISDDESIYWFLYTVQLLLNDANCMSMFNNQVFKETLLKRLDELQYVHENNGDCASNGDGKNNVDNGNNGDNGNDNGNGNKVIFINDSDSKGVRRENIYVTCCKLKGEIGEV